VGKVPTRSWSTKKRGGQNAEKGQKKQEKRAGVAGPRGPCEKKKAVTGKREGIVLFSQRRHRGGGEQGISRRREGKEQKQSWGKGKGGTRGEETRKEQS